MQDLTGKVNNGGATAAGQLSAEEWNQLPDEVQNVITALGITLSSGDLNQLGKAISGYVANGTFYTDSGVANSYVLSGVGAKQRAPAYTNGFEIDFIAGNSNTGPSTVNVGGLGVKSIKLPGGGDPGTGKIDGRTKCVFDSANDWFELVEFGSGGPALGTDSIIRTNAQNIAEDITFAGTENGMTAGPITIDDTHTVTVTSGSTWTVV